MTKLSIGAAAVLGVLLSSTAFAAPCGSVLAQNRGAYQPGQSGDVAQNSSQTIELACR
jgi:hypothetical protein